MRKYHDLSLTYQSIKSARRPKQEPILIEDSYSTNRPTVSGQRFTYDRDYFKNQLKTPHSHRIVQFQQKQPEKYLQYNETSKSLIVSPEKEDIYERNNSKEKHPINLLQRSSRKMEVPIPKPKNEPFKKLKNPELLIKEDKYLQMAKKEKQKNHPTFTLMFNPKSPRKVPKTQRNIFEELRQTEDTIPDNFQQKKPSYLKPSDFHQVRLLGKGKNGQVYLAIHKKTGFACAMKIIKKKDINRGSFIEREKLYTQLLRQIKIQMFMSHPNLVQLYCVFSDKQNIYLIQQLGINGQLYELMRKKNKLSQQSTALISREILQGLKAMHQKNIIHRDLKPQNIVLIYGIAKICDFGSSVHCSSEMRSTLCGTPLYLSPQILVGEEYNQKIDIWAYGTLVYELFTGQNPFRVKHKFQLIKIVTDQLIFEDNFPKKLKHFLLFILKKNSLERPKAEEIQKHQFLKKYAQLQTSQELSNL